MEQRDTKEREENKESV